MSLVQLCRQLLLDMRKAPQQLQRMLLGLLVGPNHESRASSVHLALERKLLLELVGLNHCRSCQDSAV